MISNTIQVISYIRQQEESSDSGQRSTKCGQDFQKKHIVMTMNNEHREFLGDILTSKVRDFYLYDNTMDIRANNN